MDLYDKLTMQEALANRPIQIEAEHAKLKTEHKILGILCQNWKEMTPADVN